MSNLSPHAQLLVRAAAKAARPNDADRARLYEIMRGRLGDAAMVGEASVTAGKGIASALWAKVTAATLGVGLLIGGGAAATHRAPEHVAKLGRPLIAAERIAPLAFAPSTPVPAATPEAATVTVARVAPPVARRAGDRLAQEVALLSRATGALRSGRPVDALKALNEHQSLFPKGLLAEERRAARAQALCALNRRGEARADLATLGYSSPQAARARQACGI